MQVYADPERPGPTELHATFFSAAGAEEPVDVVTVAADGRRHRHAPAAGPGPLRRRRRPPPPARWPVEVTGVTAGGDYLYAPLTLEIER